MLTVGYWPFGLVMCDVWQLSDVVMCTSSIMHMSTISLDRYTAIRDPLGSRAARGRSPTTFWVKIGAVWTASIVIGSPLIVSGVNRCVNGNSRLRSVTCHMRAHSVTCHAR